MPNATNRRQRIGNHVKRVATLQTFKDNFYDSTGFYQWFAHGANEAYNLIVKGEPAPVYGGASIAPAHIDANPEPTDKDVHNTAQANIQPEPIYAAAEPVAQPGYTVTEATPHTGLPANDPYLVPAAHSVLDTLVQQAEQHVEHQFEPQLESPELEPDID